MRIDKQNTGGKEPLKKAQKQQNCKCGRLGLIEPVHGR